MPTRETTLRCCLVLVALIHLAPATGVIWTDRLATLYEVPVTGPDLAILMRHRAVLFAILGALLIASAARRDLRTTAIAAGFVSVGSFLALAWTTGGYNAAIGRVVAVDLVALVLLALSALLHRRR